MRALQIPRFNPMHENSEARKIDGPLRYIGVPTTFDSGGLGVILSLPKASGAGIFGIYILIAELAGRMPKRDGVRGWLVSDRGAMSVEEIAARIRLPSRAVAAAISVLTRPEIGWLKWVDIPDQSLPKPCPAPVRPPLEPRSNPDPSPSGTSVLNRREEKQQQQGNEGEGTAAAGAAAAGASPGEGKPDPDAYLVPYVAALTAAGIGGTKREALARSLAVYASPDVAKAAIEGIRKRHKEIGGKGTGALIGDVEAWIEQRSARPSPALPQADKATEQAAKDRAAHAAEVAERDAAFVAIPAELVPELEREAIEAAAPITRERWQKTEARAATHALLKIEVIRLAKTRGLLAGVGVTR